MSTTQASPLRVAVVGAGCAGSLVATHLLSQDQPVQVDIIDSRIPGRGLAYSTAWDQHLLNVRAARMSAFGAEPGHFLDWLKNNGHPESNSDSFAPRKVFGSYLQDILQTAIRSASPGHRFRHYGSSVAEIFHDGAKARILLVNGDRIASDRVVLATGNPSPRPLGSTSERYLNSPWDRGALTGLDRQATVLLVGSGLTAVDAFLALDAQGHQGSIYCVSRRGKLSHVHTVYRSLPTSFTSAGVEKARDLVRALRKRVKEAEAQGYEWRAVVDSLRPITNDLWEQFGTQEKARILRHLKTWWDIHRHRMAPEIGVKIEKALAAGRLRIVAGRLKRITPDIESDRLKVEILLRGQGQMALAADRVINCTGPEDDYRRSANPLMRSLMESGRVHADPIGKGLRTDTHGALIDSQGLPSDWLFTLGPPRLGGLFETTAVPELRIQAEALVYHLVAKPYAPPPTPIDDYYYMAAGI